MKQVLDSETPKYNIIHSLNEYFVFFTMPAANRDLRLKGFDENNRKNILS